MEVSANGFYISLSLMKMELWISLKLDEKTFTISFNPTLIL